MGTVRTPSIEEKILDCFPSGHYALTALLKLLDIVETTEVATAAVECRIQPRLRINPDFVATHANTPEKLLMLVMHELHHVLLGHTTLFPAITPFENFVFDCVINGLICRMFPGDAYTGLLRGFYSDVAFPECLLRPAEGWPGTFDVLPPGITALEEPLRRHAAALHYALYSPAGASYEEVARVLPMIIVQVGEGALDRLPLLGDHEPGGATAGHLEHRSPVLFDAVRSIVEHWPQPPDPIKGRSIAQIVRESHVEVTRSPSNRTVLRRLIRRLASSSAVGTARRPGASPTPSATVLPTLDRRSAVLRTLGVTPLLQSGSVLARRRRAPGERVHVYLDVSGSMDSVKSALFGAVLDCAGDVWSSVHLFSTEVVDLPIGQLRSGVCRSTGGTDIACVAAHLRKHRIGRALLITDGWVGAPSAQDQATLKKVRLAVAYLGSTTNPRDLQGFVDFDDHLSPEQPTT